jgi:hypothetical protein
MPGHNYNGIEKWRIANINGREGEWFRAGPAYPRWCFEVLCLPA